jgi:sugar (pentulose or hexulose) kinase
MTQACLDLTGASGLIIVEGPFARNPLYVGALGKVTWRPVIGVAGATGTSAGAALPASGALTHTLFPAEARITPVHLPEDLPQYRTEWARHAPAD